MKEIIQVEDSFEIKNRGTVYTFKAPKWVEEWSKINTIMNNTFEFNYQDNNVTGKVIGIERMGIERPLLEGDNCGWLLKDIKPKITYD